jgi:POT family proton-dependent oligopeptide transporter
VTAVSDSRPGEAAVSYARAPEKTFLGHPVGLYVLFFSELWERFSFYGMKALLVLYMVNALKYVDERAYGIYGAYAGFVYATPLFGGMLADRLLGYRRAIILGGILMCLGHFAMAVQDPIFFYGAMALIIAGNGFFKPNISSIVGSLYEQNDPRRDSGFTIFYMGINAGAGIAPIACGFLAAYVGWHYGFALAGVGMVAGLAVFIWGERYLGTAGRPPRPEALRESFAGILPKTLAVYLGVLLFVPFAAYMLTQPDWVENGMYVIGGIFLLYVLYLALVSDRAARGGLLTIIVLSVSSIVFWACFEQAGSSMTVFAEREVNRTVLGFEIPAATLLAINPVYIILLGIPFTILWSKLARVGRNPSSPVKFGLAMIQLGLGFIAMVIAAQETRDGSQAWLGWLVLAYLLHTTGELCLSPVGLSAVTKLSPAHLTGLMMGFWFFCTAFAGVTGGVIARLTSDDGGYVNVFSVIVYVSVGAGILLLLLSPLLNRLTRPIKQVER